MQNPGAKLNDRHDVAGIDYGINPSGLQALSSGTLAVLDQALISLKSFVTLLLMAHFCSEHQVTLYALGWSLLNVARVIQERTFGASYVVLSHQPDREPTAFTGSSLAHQLVFATSCATLFLVAGASYNSLDSQLDGPQGFGSCLFAIGFAIPFILIRDHLRILSGANLKYGTAAALSGSAFVLQLILLFALQHFRSLEADWAFAAMGLASLIPVIFWFLAQPIPIQVIRSQIRKDWFATIRFSRWLVVARVFPISSAALLPWIVYWIEGDHGAAIFATCMAIANVCMLVIQGSNNYLQLRTVLAFNAGKRNSMIRVMSLSALLYGAILIVPIIFVWFRGNWLLTILLGHTYTGHKELLLWMLVHMLLISFSTVFGNGMSAMSKPSGLFPGELGYAIVAVLAALGLTSSFGLDGAGIAVALAGLTSVAVTGLCFQSVLREYEAAEKA